MLHPWQHPRQDHRHGQGRGGGQGSWLWCLQQQKQQEGQGLGGSGQCVWWLGSRQDLRSARKEARQANGEPALYPPKTRALPTPDCRSVPVHEFVQNRNKSQLLGGPPPVHFVILLFKLFFLSQHSTVGNVIWCFRFCEVAANLIPGRFCVLMHP